MTLDTPLKLADTIETMKDSRPDHESSVELVDISRPSYSIETEIFTSYISMKIQTT